MRSGIGRQRFEILFGVVIGDDVIAPDHDIVPVEDFDRFFNVCSGRFLVIVFELGVAERFKAADDDF